MDHSDEQPASQNHSHRLQQKQTDRVTGQLQCLNGPGNTLSIESVLSANKAKVVLYLGLEAKKSFF